MKIKLLTLLLGLSTLSYAQITKAEVFLTGTKLAFYPNECGNSIPEAAGKLTFCDNNNALGVVERSYGLNDRAVQKMLPNYANEDEVFLTRTGISIRNTDGSWENIPDIALPDTINGNWVNNSDSKDGLVLPNGNLIFLHQSSLGDALCVFDRTSKTLTNIALQESNIFLRKMVYDPDRDLTWFLAYSSNGQDRYLYRFDGNNLEQVAILFNLNSLSLSYNGSKLIYENDHLYFAHNSGLYEFDVTDYLNSNIGEFIYDSGSTPSIPFDWVRDLQFDANGDLWMAQSDGSADGGVVKFDVDAGTYDLYQLPTQNNPAFNYAFKSIALDDSGTVWTNASNFSGAMKFTLPGGTPTWDVKSLSDFSDSGYPMTYNPENIHYYNNKFYFTTVDFSSGNNENFEVVINDNDVLSGRNDNEAGNLSYWMSSRFTNVLADAVGGVWWFSNFDDIIMYRDADDNHQSIVLDNIGLQAAIDEDNNAVVRSGNPNRIRKIDFPNAIDIQEGNNSAIDLKRVGNKILIYDNNEQKVDVYQNNALMDTYNFNDDWYDFAYHFAADNEGFLWHFRYVSGLQVKSYNTDGGQITTYDRPESLSTLKKVVAGPDGVWFIGVLGAIYYEAGTFYSFLAADYDEIYKLEDAVVDSNGKLYMLNIDNASITTIENPTDANPVLTNTSLQTSTTNSLLPALDHNRPDAIAIDSEGSVWTHASLNAFKLLDNDFATQYNADDNLTLGIIEPELSTSLVLSPNPSNGKIEIETTHSFERIEIYDILGKKVKELPFTSTIIIEDLQSGIYMLKLKSENINITKKILLN